MKTIVTIILFLAAYYGSQAQSIQYKQSSINITCDGGFSTNDNTIRYSITSDLNDAYLLGELFKDKSFSVVNGIAVYSGSASVSNMWQIIDMVEIEQEDVGTKIKPAIIKWSINMIYDMNLLNINKSDWAVKN